MLDKKMIVVYFENYNFQFMTETIQPKTLSMLKNFLLDVLGLYYSDKQDAELCRKITQAATDFGFNDLSNFFQWLFNNELSPVQISKLSSFLTIGETYFMREKKGFDFLEQIYLPGLIHKRNVSERKLRIWCAGCATGEEAYSLAIILQQTIPKISDWDITLLATDINPVFLDKAKKGIYSKWSFRNNSDEFKDNNFIRVANDAFQIKPEIQKIVTFANLNLAENIYPSAKNSTNNMDVIFCRNVMIYFATERIAAVTERFYQSLKTGGILQVSPVEMSNLIHLKFKRIYYSGFTIYLKSDNVEPKNSKAEMLGNKQILFKQNKKGISEEKIQFHKKQIEPSTLLHTTPLKVSNITETLHNNLLQAKLLYEQGSFEEAETLLSQQNNEDNSIQSKEEIALLAKIKANLGKLHEAQIWCEKGLSLNKLDSGLHYLLATIQHENGNYDQSIISLKMAIYLEPDFVLAHFLLGTLVSKKGDIKAGNKAFRNALLSLAKLAPDDFLPESDGLTVNRFREIINAITN